MQKRGCFLREVREEVAEGDEGGAVKRGDSTVSGRTCTRGYRAAA